MGAGLQTCRKLIEDGWIGKPIAATAFMLGGGPDNWHPNPFFFYEAGGGPMLDIGPYYLTALVSLLGPVRRVAAATKITFNERPLVSGPHAGEKIPVSTPTHLAGVLDFANGAIASVITSFDVKGGHGLPPIEIYGTTGSLKVPDPNTFGGPVLVRRTGMPEWKEVPLSHSYAENSRGLGVADMAKAILAGRTHRASGELAFHVLDVMLSFAESSKNGKHAQIKSTCAKPAPLPLGLAEGQID
jgi:predicted dehydrogenase